MYGEESFHFQIVFTCALLKGFLFSALGFPAFLISIYLSMKDLCEKSGIGVSTLQKVRKGNTPRPATLGRIAKALNVDVQDIIQEGE